MSKKNAKTPENETDDIVKLKPLFGIKPGVYLTVFYSAALLLILFFIFVHHGLVNHGAVLIVKTEPAGAAVRINDTYMGTSGTKIHIPNSIKPNETVNIQVVLPGFEPEGEACEIPGRIFGTRFFPRAFKLEYTLKTLDPYKALANAASEYAAWSFGGEPTEAWQIPLVLSEGVYRTGQSMEIRQIMASKEILKSAARFTVTRAALRDLTRAKILLDNMGQAPSPSALTGSLSDILVFLSENPGSAKWLTDVLPAESAALVRESNWYKNELQTAVLREPAAGTINITAVPKTLFKNFLAENPEWQDHYIDYFEDDIAGHPAQIYGSDIVTGVSWYAAEAFCKWLTKRLPASQSNMEVRLPTQAELEIARNRESIAGWEWCADPFAPLNFNSNIDAIQAVGSPERAIYGKQTANSPLTRASLPPNFRSPIVTFRTVIAEKQ
ncbi:MAG: formylglycine-generating enzyme family protein [Treponema sp.]|jgi:hypothetical protein|nr:formylglycine-generating enzyme family protein [Treponema sp.]